MSVMPFHLSPKPRRVSASITHVATFTDSSPRFVLTISPVAPTQSPRLILPKPSKSSVTAASANSWISSPLPSRKVAKASLPWARCSITRPATLTVMPVSSPSARPSCAARSSAVVAVTSKRYGGVTAGSSRR
jgi:hypothetical protein